MPHFEQFVRIDERVAERVGEFLADYAFPRSWHPDEREVHKRPLLGNSIASALPEKRLILESMICIKRAYEAPQKSDGYRVLVDRLWPRGVSKAALKLDAWRKDIAPSSALRVWFNHDPKRWTEFKKRYKAELRSHRPELSALKKTAKRITLVYGAKDPLHNHALVLQEMLEKA
jgi:uncharacterized protein YeaO (DUF488 family)